MTQRIPAPCCLLQAPKEPADSRRGPSRSFTEPVAVSPADAAESLSPYERAVKKIFIKANGAAAYHHAYKWRAS